MGREYKSEFECLYVFEKPNVEVSPCHNAAVMNAFVAVENDAGLYISSHFPTYLPAIQVQLSKI